MKEIEKLFQIKELLKLAYFKNKNHNMENIKDGWFLLYSKTKSIIVFRVNASISLHSTG